MIGWKVMRADPDGRRLVSGADPRIYVPATIGRWITMPGQGIWMSLDRAHVLDHYAVHDVNALLALEFDPGAVLHGSLEDRDTEFTVRRACIRSITIFKSDTDPDDAILADRVAAA